MLVPLPAAILLGRRFLLYRKIVILNLKLEFSLGLFLVAPHRDARSPRYSYDKDVATFLPQLPSFMSGIPNLHHVYQPLNTGRFPQTHKNLWLRALGPCISPPGGIFKSRSYQVNTLMGSKVVWQAHFQASVIVHLNIIIVTVTQEPKKKKKESGTHFSSFFFALIYKQGCVA